jgi:hypothetical protein
MYHIESALRRRSVQEKKGATVDDLTLRVAGMALRLIGSSFALKTTGRQINPCLGADGSSLTLPLI